MSTRYSRRQLLTDLPGTLLGLFGLVASVKAAAFGPRRPRGSEPPKSREAVFGSRLTTITYTEGQLSRLVNPGPAGTRTTFVYDPRHSLGYGRDDAAANSPEA